ncbi:hypothetical protein NSK_002586 [Nannochloropsis salina CCMP1776]|uniref:NAD-dependent epimerase/dehydratase domain-containing protein n=1 Tax=Nannochloropsis salina CCMP1776 TaxID=1027361 RepID=A0A4D9DCM8_9STRA|nr:hypothetical protein NSK_002586 [Nannochloropsis salina CCMP1776]|eukprot:TFJ86378.1 hypothetical protein NSK_002586 [Nannochloropsis salina CCMP1776]
MLARRAFSTGNFGVGKLEQGFKEFGPGGRSSVAGITASLFGGTGFLGKYLQFELGKTGFRLYLANRGDEQDVRAYKVAFDLGQWASVPYSLRDEDSVKRVLEGSDIAINCIGKYYDTKHLVPHRDASGKLSNVNFSLEEVHIEAPAKLAELAKSVGVSHFLHVSALGADKDSSVRWLATKGQGEEALKSVFPRATIVRPGRLFGPEDRLLNWFAQNAASFGVIPLFNSGNALLQPTYASDVVDAMVKIIEDPEDYEGKTFELAGEHNFTWRELMDFTFDITYQKPRVVDLPLAVGEMAAFGLSQLPNPLLTIDDAKLMSTDVILEPSSSAMTFQDLHIKPTPLEKVAFNYLYRYRTDGGHFPYAEGYH